MNPPPPKVSHVKINNLRQHQNLVHFVNYFIAINFEQIAIHCFGSVNVFTFKLFIYIIFIFNEF